MLGGDKKAYKYTLGAFANSTMFYVATYGFNGTVGS